MGKEVKKFNVNSWVKVKLTEKGVEELKRQHDELREMLPKLGEFKEPNVDEDGYTKFQMHDLMNRFGRMVQPGLNPPFEVVILFDEDDLV